MPVADGPFRVDRSTEGETMTLKTIESLGDLTGRTVLLRADLNVPLDDGTITDDGRVRASLPTIRQLSGAGAKVLVAAHLGRPKGAPDPRFSLQPVAGRLSELLGQEVGFATDTAGDSAREIASGLGNGDVALLENVRFNAGETSQDDAERLAFARALAALADAYVSDGFGVVHRKQASTYDIATLLPSAVGELVLNEVENLRRVTDEPARPFVTVLGGSKVSDKLGVIENLLDKADRILIGGGMAYTFYRARGWEVGTSLLEEDQVEAVRGYLRAAEEKGVELVLPVDTVVTAEFAADAPAETVASDAIPADRMGLDVGPLTRELFASKIVDAGTVFWNGPMGVFEFPRFAEGTRAVAQALVDADGFTVVGGGDSAAAVRNLGFDEAAFGHISTGGGASLELIEGKTLPGVSILED